MIAHYSSNIISMFLLQIVSHPDESLILNWLLICCWIMSAPCITSLITLHKASYSISFKTQHSILSISCPPQIPTMLILFIVRWINCNLVHVLFLKLPHPNDLFVFSLFSSSLSSSFAADYATNCQFIIDLVKF